jgi:hypothetical protein
MSPGHHQRPIPQTGLPPLQNQTVLRYPLSASGIDARRVSGPPGADRPDWHRRPRIRHRPPGHAIVAARADEATKKRVAKLQTNGKPIDFKQLLRLEPDSGTTNIGNVKSKHRTRWLGVENKAEGGDMWFALDENVIQRLSSRR